MILRVGCTGALLIGALVITPFVGAGIEGAFVAVGTGAGWGLALCGAFGGLALLVLAVGHVGGTLYEAHTRRLVALALTRQAPHLPPPGPTEGTLLTGQVVARYDIDH